ncbi:MAG: type II toxin-antitoxin system VapC family toxin [Deltaproteobacteria bacterium]|nr:type II toxin-antitoxin system VapC family toxin [Deltaproteobacteria bacterium]
MTVLLDTHALLWWLKDSPRLGRTARALMVDRQNTVLVSAASIWEITTKYRIGKLSDIEAIVHDLPAVVRAEGFSLLAIAAEHAARAGLLASDHRDPFDRVLAAQSLADGLTLLSYDEVFDSMGVTRLW